MTPRDEQLVALAQAGDRAAGNELCRRYHGACRAAIRAYFLPGGEPDDLLQEAFGGLTEAIRDYQRQQGPFGAFAQLVIRRNVIEAVKKATRLKHRPLNDAYPLMRDAGNGYDHDDYDDFNRGHAAPDLFEQREHVLQLLAITDLAVTLSPLERRSLGMSLDGVPYRGDKSVDNAIQRARRKLRVALDDTPVEAAA